MASPVRVSRAAVLAALAAGACARAATPADTLVPAASAGRFAGLDSGSVRRLCAEPDSVLAGRAACVLRDQARPAPVRPPPEP